MMLKRLVFLMLVWFSAVEPVIASSAQQLFSQYHDRIYQIRLIELASGSKSSIGSGFQINADGLIATNFHVVAEAVHKPEKYRVEYINHKGKHGELEILDINVLHDLALLRHHDGYQPHFTMANQPVHQGEDLFSLGNPRDLGMTVVTGTYNGLLAHSFYDRILFSGSLNPGMSGGPALNNQGDVIGVNVATSGNQLSFLVPLKELTALIEQYQQQTARGGQDFQAKIQRQLIENQDRQINALLASDWPKTALGYALTAGEMAWFTRCWGGSSEDDKALYEHTYSRCFSESDIFLSNMFSTGAINYEFYWLETSKLNPLQFYERYRKSIEGAGPVNQAEKENVGNFECQHGFVDQPLERLAPVVWKSVLCARPYKQYKELYDLVFIGATISDPKRGLVSHFAISGVTQELGLRFTKKFMEHVEWR